MARLKKKRPASTKKKKKGGTKSDNRQVAVGQESSTVSAVQQRPVQNRESLPRSEVPKAIKPSGRKLQPAFLAKSVQFLREVKIELKKVTWPSRKETLASTGVVIIIVVIISAFLGLVDMGLSSLIRFVLG
ncbi:MAG: preprotein translocase subunit SecE [Deltaproteobacteria bacterium]|nr:preprotein translocase subunit SecE [Deltaproteobacteria bacterium]